MIAQLLRMIVEGYTAPGRSMRALFDGGSGTEEALAFLALAFLVEAILAIIFGGRAGGLSIGVYLVNLALQLAVFFLLSGLIHGIGRAAGGTGTLTGAQVVVGWHALVTSPMTPLTIGFASAFRAQTGGDGTAAQVQIPAGGGFLALLYIAISFWLMANYVAELHGFRNTWGVLGAIVGVTFACGIVLVSVAGSLTQ
jgi:Yip1 domain